MNAWLLKNYNFNKQTEITGTALARILHENESLQLKINTMITQYEVTPLLKREIPRLAGKVYPCNISLDVYVSMNYFSDYTEKALEEHDFSLAKKCFLLAEKIYQEGDRMVRLLIENIFVYRFSGFLFNDKVENKLVKAMIPPVLYSLYIKQVVQSGC